jgi:branched-chain amino acid transport system ATP-binding protein
LTCTWAESDMTKSTLGTSIPRLSAHDVSVSFAGLKALSDVSFDLAAGELLGVIGPNGAGKTTLVNVITGFQRPNTGAVTLDGDDITKVDEAARARRGVTRTFQAVRLFEHLTVQENIEVAALNRGGRRAARQHAQEAIELLGLGRWSSTPSARLPYGDQRRLALARCLAMDPKVMLMDEPAAGLNDEETFELGNVIKRIQQEHRPSIVLIEHDVPLVMRLSNRVLVLVEGRPLMTGTPEEVRENPDVVLAYLGSAHAES